MSPSVLCFNLELNNFMCFSGAQLQTYFVVIIIAIILQMKKSTVDTRDLTFPRTSNGQVKTQDAPMMPGWELTTKVGIVSYN